MIIEVKVPSPGESITEVQLANWLVKDGAFVDKDMDIAEIDSDKATLSITAPEAGIIVLKVNSGMTIAVGDTIALINTEGKGTAEKPAVTEVVGKKSGQEPVVATKETPPVEEPAKKQGVSAKEENEILHLSPLAKKLLDHHNLSEQEFIDFLKKQRISRADVEYFVSNKNSRDAVAETQKIPWGGSRNVERKKMSTLRLKLSERLVAVKNETAMLTTFNEVNMTPIMEIRKKFKDVFKEKHGVSLGFMSFFTKAVTEALHLFPQVNAAIDGEEIVYHDYADIGIAVSTPKGLMVPVLRNAETMSLADIELNIKEIAERARNNKITLDEMKGGTFTITNGGVFGSMLSTPIINPPQSAILGMHNIVERPIVVDGKIEIHPMMYLALSYDHRIIDGRESVSFLVKVKEMLENPVKMLFSGQDPLVELLGLGRRRSEG